MHKNEAGTGGKTGLHLCQYACTFTAIVFVTLTVIIYYYVLSMISTMYSSAHDNTTRRLVCYWTWNNGKTIEESIDSTLCTHLIIGFASVGSDFRLNLSSIGGEESIKKIVTGLRVSNASIMISVGGGGGSPLFGEMIQKQDRIQLFLESCLQLIQTTGLNGIDYDWEFPSFWEKQPFSNLLKKTHQTLTKEFPNFELSVALPGPFTLTIGYDVVSLVSYCTFVNVMTYDLALLNPIYKRTLLHSALEPNTWWMYPFTVKFCTWYWLMLGIPRTMINMGIPTYGVAYDLTDVNYNGLMAPVNGYSRYGSNVYYRMACKFRSLHPENFHWSNESYVPYIHDGNGTWISYDNVASVRAKVDFAISEGLGGLMIFSLNADDYQGYCKEGKYPLTSAATKSWRHGT